MLVKYQIRTLRVLILNLQIKLRFIYNAYFSVEFGLGVLDIRSKKGFFEDELIGMP